jgi:hypothetical protein
VFPNVMSVAATVRIEDTITLEESPIEILDDD